MTVPTTLNDVNVFGENELSLAGGQTVALQINPNGDVSTDVLTQTSGPEIGFGRVTVTNPMGGTLRSGGSIRALGPGDNFTFTFPDDDATPRMTAFPIDGSFVSLEVKLPAVTQNTIVEWNFALSSDTETVNSPVRFTITPNASGKPNPFKTEALGKLSTFEVSSYPSSGVVTLYGRASKSNIGNMVTAYDNLSSMQAGNTPPLGTTYVSFDGTFKLSLDKSTLASDDVFVFMLSEAGDSLLSRFHVVESGYSAIVSTAGR